MNYTSHTSNIRNIRQGDPGFYIYDGVVAAARAGIEITSDCPSDEAFIIRQAFAKGWIQLVANVKDNELVWESLSQ
jgi:hypothetical protein